MAIMSNWINPIFYFAFEKIINNFYLTEFIESFFGINVNYSKSIHFFELKFININSISYGVINKLSTSY